MAETTIANIKDAFKLFEEKLNEAVATLQSTDRISVERVTHLESFEPRSARGGFGIIFNGSDFNKDPRVGGTALRMKNDLFIGVISMINFFEVMGEPIDKQPMMPFEYTELAVNTLSGIEVWNTRPETERKIYPIRTELVDEDRGRWKYLTTFGIPIDFTEQNL